jgi:hypothetical protein
MVRKEYLSERVGARKSDLDDASTIVMYLSVGRAREAGGRLGEVTPVWPERPVDDIVGWGEQGTEWWSALARRRIQFIGRKQARTENSVVMSTDS